MSVTFHYCHLTVSTEQYCNEELPGASCCIFFSLLPLWFLHCSEGVSFSCVLNDIKMHKQKVKKHGYERCINNYSL